MKQKIQLIEQEITAPTSFITLSDELDSQFDFLTGIAFLDNIPEGSLLATSSVDGIELFPKDFETEFLKSNASVSPNERFFSIDKREAKGNTIELGYSDINRPESTTYPYTLRVYLRLENE